MNLLVLTQKVNTNDAILGFFVKWLEQMALRVDRLFVIALEKGDFDLPSNVEVISLGKEKGAKSITMLWRFNLALLRLCQKQKPDAIWAHMVPKFALYSVPVASLYRIPIDLWYTHKGVDKYLRLVHPFLRYVFTASEESFRLKSKKKTVTGHGIDTHLFRPSSETERNGIISVGRIAPSKDPKTLIEAVGLMKEGHRSREVECRIFGEPLLISDRSYLEEMRTLVIEEGLDKRILFKGALPHNRLVEKYQEAKVLVNASHTGSVDKVVLEAMACGALPLTCNESFVPLLEDMAPKLVFEKHNAQDLATKIENLLDMDSHDQKELSGRLREIVVNHHNLEKLMDKMLSQMGA